MNKRLAHRIEALSESATLKMAQLARQLRAEGKDIISLGIGEPDFDTPPAIRQAGIDAINNNVTHYPPVIGMPELRDAIASRYNKRFDTKYTRNNVIVSNGAKQSLSNAILCLCDHEDEVIIPTPYWVSYPEMVRMAGGIPVFIEGKFENDYKITPEQLDAAITDKTRLFIFSTPSNPSGSVYCNNELEALAEIFRKYPDIIIISDEIYEYINFVGHACSFSEVKDLIPRLVIINGVSKGYAMTGWRLGYMLAAEWIVNATNKLQGQTTSGASSISQMAAIKAISEEHSETKAMCRAFKRRRDLVLRLLKDFPDIKVNTPEGAFYLLINLSSYFGKKHNGNTIKNADDMAMYVLEEAHVSMVSGIAFGIDDCVRISFATSDRLLEEAMNRFKAALNKLV